MKHNHMKLFVSPEKKLLRPMEGPRPGWPPGSATALVIFSAAVLRWLICCLTLCACLSVNDPRNTTGVTIVCQQRASEHVVVSPSVHKSTSGYKEKII